MRRQAHGDQRSRPRPASAPTSSPTRVDAVAARYRRRQDRRAGRGRRVVSGQRRDQLVPAPGAARLRRRGRVRRRVHHLQRLLDHRRPAPARVRHAARPRRVTPPGADQRHRRGAPHGRRSPRSPASSPAWAWPSSINQLFKAVGADIPVAGLGLEPRTVVVALVVGIGTALVAALVPALRATRVPPVAALQEGAVLPASRFAARARRWRSCVGAGRHRHRRPRLLRRRVDDHAPARDGPAARCCSSSPSPWSRSTSSARSTRVIGWPLERLGGTTGRLARENAGRNPARTANTAAALMIGLGLVVFVAVFAQGLKSSFIDVFDRTRQGRRRDHRQRELPAAVGEGRRGDARRRPASRR